MIKFRLLCKTSNSKSKNKRNIKEVHIKDISLKEYLVIDVRSRREYNEGHINGAINIPLPEIKKNIRKYALDNEKKILLYCQSGIRSKEAAETIKCLGYDNVYNLKGGLENI